MSTFQKRIDSKKRIIELEKVFKNTIEEFSYKNPELTMEEVCAVMFVILTRANDKQIRRSVK